MTNTALIALMLCFAAPTLASEAGVATLNDLAGTVKVDTGEGFAAAVSGQVLHAGDRILTLDESRAQIVFTDGCTAPAKPQSINTVPVVSPCAGGQLATQTTQPTGTGAIGTQPNYRALAGIALTVLVGDTVLFQEDDSETASP